MSTHTVTNTEITLYKHSKDNLSTSYNHVQMNNCPVKTKKCVASTHLLILSTDGWIQTYKMHDNQQTLNRCSKHIGIQQHNQFTQTYHLIKWIKKFTHMHIYTERGSTLKGHERVHTSTDFPKKQLSTNLKSPSNIRVRAAWKLVAGYLRFGSSRCPSDLHKHSN